MIETEPTSARFAVTVVNGMIPDKGAESTTELRFYLASAAVVCLRFDRALEKSEFEQIAEIFGPVKDPVGRAKDGTVFRYSPRRQVIDAGYVLTDQDRQTATFNYGGLG